MQLILDHKSPEAGDATSFFFKPNPELVWQAGQYCIYVLPHEHPDDRKDRRFFTISAAPFEGATRITTRLSPKGSTFKHALDGLQPGQSIEAIKTGGDFIMDDPTKQHVFIAGGIGITPYRSILKQLDHDGQPLNVSLLYGNRTDEFVFQTELEEMAGRHPEFRTRYLVEPQRIDEALLKEFLPDHPTFWISGPEPMVEGFETTLKKLNVPERDIKTDYFPGYNWP